MYFWVILVVSEILILGLWEGPCEWEGPRKTVLVLVLFVPMWFLCCFLVFVGPIWYFWDILVCADDDSIPMRGRGPMRRGREKEGEGGWERGWEGVDRPTQLICISDIYVNRQTQKT